MRDGVTIAIDVHVPRDAGEKIPAIIRQTRYLRSLEMGAVMTALGLPRTFDLYAGWRRLFLASGYAWVDVDVRGTGASTGVWHSPWFDDEVKDGAEVATWICGQPWSNGKIGTLGISYDGTAAEMLLVNGHPAVRAAAPLFSLYDVYADVAFPGGVHLAWFTEEWARYNAALDRNAHAEAMTIPLWLMACAAKASPRPNVGERILAQLGRLDRTRFERVLGGVLGRMVHGVRHVERAGDGAPPLAQRALRADNLDVHAGARRLEFRDDAGVHPRFPERTIDSFSPHAFRDAIRASGAAIYSYSGWRDGAYQNAATKRYREITNGGSRLTLGPWAHTGKLRIHAFGLGEPSVFDHGAELLDFFDAQLRDERSFGDGAPVHYFTMGEERWKASTSWPPPPVRTLRLHLAAGRSLAEEAPADGMDDHAFDADLGTGHRSRWRSLISIVPGDYPDRRARDGHLLAYDSHPIGHDTEVTGHPKVRIFVAWNDGDDGTLFAYLEDVRPDGAIAYVTEGQLRATHRALTFRRVDARTAPAGETIELAFELLPISYLFRRGHRIRLVLAAGDRDHFVPPRATRLCVHRGRAFPSRIELPVVG
jgi:putative CocE/NonD family hydrolase